MSAANINTTHFSPETGLIYWPDISLSTKSNQTRTFTIKILDPIPSTAIGSINKNSYDCNISNFYGQTINTKIDCPLIKNVENIINQLPRVNIDTNIIYALILLPIFTYYYLRSSQLEKEIRLIRKDSISGTL